MSESTTPAQRLDTSAGEFELHECRVSHAGREWAVLHTGAVLSLRDEVRVIGEKATRLPYGVALWPSAIALAQEIATRGLRGKILELGAGTGLPGIVAASLGARVVQTDVNELAQALCKRNGERNGVEIEYRLADWTSWEDAGKYDWVIGADVLYAESAHPQLRRIFETNLAPGGRVLLSDPFRTMSLRFLEALEGDGWGVTVSQWDVGDERPVGVFELVPPS